LHYLRGEVEREIPVWRMISTPAVSLQRRADAWLAALPSPEGMTLSVESAESTVGGGSLPGETMPTYALAVRRTRRSASWAAATAASLRRGTPCIVPRIVDDRVLLDPRTVLPEQDDALLARLREIINGVR
jgi:L-seryl-tRNA(Ser) seleniumtransferase